MKGSKKFLKVMMTIAAITAATTFTSTNRSTHAMWGEFGSIAAQYILPGAKKVITGLGRNMQDFGYRNELIKRLLSHYIEYFQLSKDFDCGELITNNKKESRNYGKTFAGMIEKLVDDVLTVIRYKGNYYYSFKKDWIKDTNYSYNMLMADVEELDRMHNSINSDKAKEAFFDAIIKFSHEKTNLTNCLVERCNYVALEKEKSNQKNKLNNTNNVKEKQNINTNQNVNTNRNINTNQNVNSMKMQDEAYKCIPIYEEFLQNTDKELYNDLKKLEGLREDVLSSSIFQFMKSIGIYNSDQFNEMCCKNYKNLAELNILNGIIRCAIANLSYSEENNETKQSKDDYSHNNNITDYNSNNISEENNKTKQSKDDYSHNNNITDYNSNNISEENNKNDDESLINKAPNEYARIYLRFLKDSSKIENRELFANLKKSFNDNNYDALYTILESCICEFIMKNNINGIEEFSMLCMNADGQSDSDAIQLGELFEMVNTAMASADQF